MDNELSSSSFVTVINFGGSNATFDMKDDFDPSLSQGLAIVDSYGNSG